MPKSISFSGSALDQLLVMTQYAIDGVCTERGINSGRLTGHELLELNRLEDCYIKLERRIAKKLDVQSEYPDA